MSSSRSRRWILVLAISLASALAGCTGGSHLNTAPAIDHQPALPAPAAQVTPGAALPALPLPGSLLAALPHKVGPQPSRVASYIEADLSQAGNAFLPSLPRYREGAVADGAQLSPNWTALRARSSTGPT